MNDWICENCGNEDMECLYSRSSYNGNTDTTWYCEKCNPELAEECDGQVGVDR